MVLMDLTEKLQNLCIIVLCLLYRPAWQFSLIQVTDCPSSKADWDKRANKANCAIDITYHCLLSVQKVLHEGCMRYQITHATVKGDCPQVRGIDGDFVFERVNFICRENTTICPVIGSSYRSDELYKYPGCFGSRPVIQTTEKTTKKVLTDTTYSTANVPQSGLSSEEVAGIVSGSIIAGIGLLAVIIGVILLRRNKCRIREQTSSSVELSNGATQYSPVSQKEPNGVSNDSPLTVQESNGGTNHTPVPQSDPQTRPGGDTNHTRVPQAEHNSRSNVSAHEVDELPEADGGDQNDVQQDTESIGTSESTGRGGNNIIFNNCNITVHQTNEFENPAAVQVGSGNTANICSASTDNGV